ncbi:hypothetical protein [Acetobacter thailandicus]|nr:hypothetical protein [Acetobacter thailandicus]MBS0986683.1 hypothetical protein [Acetobacter thailandicus]
MGQIRHESATTTHAVRQRKNGSIRSIWLSDSNNTSLTGSPSSASL